MKQNRNFIVGITAILIIMMLASGCVNKPSEQTEPTQITVSAASTLTESFEEIVEQFKIENPEIDVQLNLASSGALRMQIEAGAPIDVFASASQQHMNLLDEKEMIVKDSRTDFAQNSMVLIVPITSELEITSVDSLLNDSVKRFVISDPEISPAGTYSKQSLVESGLWNELEGKAVLAETVKQVLVYVERGEVDAGFVFMTDAKIAKKDTIKIISTIPTSTDISYPITVLESSEHKKESQMFVDFVTGQKGRSILESHGFTA
ncbi:molybdate ABC transporter substrate-binding protein [Methanolobus sp. ZRKC4]|uniref:molybdate ABC transporter substrate-binding protein n=1 Tax=Methanolobus sp. ZRKC4 TaxID=3125787 RepID=UPI0032442FF8